AQRLSPRPEFRRAAGLPAAPPGDSESAGAGSLAALVGQSALADPRLAEQQHALPDSGRRPADDLVEQSELLGAPHQRRSRRHAVTIAKLGGPNKRSKKCRKINGIDACGLPSHRTMKSTTIVLAVLSATIVT